MEQSNPQVHEEKFSLPDLQENKEADRTVTARTSQSAEGTNSQSSSGSIAAGTQVHNRSRVRDKPEEFTDMNMLLVTKTLKNTSYDEAEDVEGDEPLQKHDTIYDKVRQPHAKQSCSQVQSCEGYISSYHPGMHK